MYQLVSVQKAVGPHRRAFSLPVTLQRYSVLYIKSLLLAYFCFVCFRQTASSSVRTRLRQSQAHRLQVAVAAKAAAAVRLCSALSPVPIHLVTLCMHMSACAGVGGCRWLCNCWTVLVFVKRRRLILRCGNSTKFSVFVEYVVCWCCWVAYLLWSKLLYHICD